jgi:hypothetical protein
VIDLDRVFTPRFQRAETILNRATRLIGIACMFIVAAHIVFGWP